MPLNDADYRDKLLIVDGDYRLELAEHGWPAFALLERANLDKPDIVRLAVDAFLDAGAVVIVTNTAAANAAVLDDFLKAGEFQQDDLNRINRRGVEIARAAVADLPEGSKRWVVGALGPSPHLLMLDEIDPQELSEAYEAQARTLADAGADALLCRSFRELDALKIAVEAAKRANLSVFASMTFDCGPDRTETTLGVTVPHASAVLLEAGADVIGCDGGESPDSAPAALALMRRLSDRPLWVQVSAGTPLLVEGRVLYPETPTEFAARLAPLAAAGANFVGGSRGASARYIAALAAARTAPTRRRSRPAR